MANLKVRGVRESINEKGPQNGPAQSMDIGAASIDNTAHKGCETQIPKPVKYLAGSDLGGKRIHPALPLKKALGG